MELVSVIMPAYNAGKYIEEAIISVMNQKYTNIELVIVNDGSTDNTGDIISEYQRRYSDRIIYIDKKVNEGTALTLNRAISEAKGNYICWLSADDLYYVDAIESLVNYVIFKKEYDIVFSDFELIDSNSTFLRESFFKKDIIELIDNSNYQPYRGLLTTGCIINGCSVIIPKKCFKEVGGFNPQYRYAHDYDLWLRLASKYSIGFLNKVNVRNRTYPEQISQLGRNEVDALSVLFDFFDKQELREALLKKAGLLSGIDGMFMILNKLLSQYKHKEQEFKTINKLGLNLLKNYEKKYDITVKSEPVSKFKIKCKLINENKIISNDAFFKENQEFNYQHYLCKYFNLDGFIVNEQAIRFDRFQGHDINRLNCGLMRNNTIVICRINKNTLLNILKERKNDFRYYINNNEDQELRIGMTYYMLYDNTYKSLFASFEKTITDTDLWSSLVDIIIEENMAKI